MENFEKFVSVREVAEATGIDYQTIRSWIREKLIPSYQLRKRGLILIRLSDVEKTISATRRG